MGQKSKLSRLPAEQRRYIEKLLREDRLTLDEMLQAIQARFPTADIPSRSGLGRYKQAVAAVSERIRGQREVARLMVGELGENPDDKAGEMLVQTITALANDVALRAAGQDDIDIESVRKLSRTIRDVVDSQAKTMKYRQAVAAQARAKAVEDMHEAAKEAGVSAEVMAAIDAKLMGR